MPSRSYTLADRNDSGMRIAIVIVNFRTPRLVAESLSALAGDIDAQQHQVVVADNASGDGSVQQLTALITERGWLSWARVVALPINGGYAAGNNAAMRTLLASAQPPHYVLLLNPDTRVRPGALQCLVDFMQQHTHVGIAGSRLEDPDGTPQRSAFRFPTVRSEFESSARVGGISRLLAKYMVAPAPPPAPCRTDWVSGASMMIRCDVFERIGLLDEGYFLFFEDTDFCLQAQRAGFPCWYVPASRVVHRTNQTSDGTDHEAGTRRQEYWLASRQRFFRKNYGWPYTLSADAAFSAGFVVWMMRRALQRQPRPEPVHIWREFLRHSALARRPR